MDGSSDLRLTARRSHSLPIPDSHRAKALSATPNINCTSLGRIFIWIRSPRCDRMELNHRRPALQAGALPTELRSQGVNGEARTLDIRGHIPALCQLSYVHRGSRGWTRTSNLPVNSRALCRLSYAGIAPVAGLEPATFGLEVRRSIRLSYTGKLNFFYLYYSSAWNSNLDCDWSGRRRRRRLFTEIGKRADRGPDSRIGQGDS